MAYHMWVDDGRTCEPCPSCGTLMKWMRVPRVGGKAARVLTCSKKECRKTTIKVVADGFKGVVERERFPIVV